jgi:hypothetical protein
MFMDRFVRWLSLGDYDDAVRQAQASIVRRFSRGNVCIQNGDDVIDEAELNQLRSKGDRAAANLRVRKQTVSQDGADYRLRRQA